jgi:hypothetical protein
VPKTLRKDHINRLIFKERQSFWKYGIWVLISARATKNLNSPLVGLFTFMV